MADLQDVWNVELDILRTFHEFCIRNNLRYSLTYGSLIGSVRHGGFIPWDDDIDVMMLREDYEKMLELWKKEGPADYILQDYREIPDYPNNFAKIRKNHTAYVQSEDEKMKSYHKGIFIDIFPIDRYPEGFLDQKIFRAACMVNLLFSRGYPSGSTGIFVTCQKMLLNFGSKRRTKILNRTEKIISRWNQNQKLGTVISCSMRGLNTVHSNSLMDRLVLVNYQGTEVLQTEEFDLFLKKQYGNYMEFPPEEERVLRHLPVWQSIDCNYEERDL